MNFASLDWGTAADWVAALAAVLGAWLSALALRHALAANRTAERARLDAKSASEASDARERARDEIDRDRERRALASNVAAWWAADREEEGRRYGVVISNQSSTSAVFYNVDVDVVGRGGARHVIHMNLLPPGQFFVEQTFDNGQARWERIPRLVNHDDVLDPFTVAGDRSIARIDYADGVGTRWTWNPTTGLSEAPTVRQ